jgi:hypothetical protein
MFGQMILSCFAATVNSQNRFDCWGCEHLLEPIASTQIRPTLAVEPSESGPATSLLFCEDRCVPRAYSIVLTGQGKCVEVAFARQRSIAHAAKDRDGNFEH